MLQDHSVSLPDAHMAVINMIRLGATTIEFKHKKILSFFQVFDGSGLDIITTVIKFIGIMTEIIKYFQQVGIDLFMQVGKMRSAIMIAGIRQVKYLAGRDDAAKPVTMPVFHFFKSVTRAWMSFN